MTTLKKVCRAHSLERWPCRKRNSLERLLNRTRQVLEDSSQVDNLQCQAALSVLENEKKDMQARLMLKTKGHAQQQATMAFCAYIMCTKCSMIANKASSCYCNLAC